MKMSRKRRRAKMRREEMKTERRFHELIERGFTEEDRRRKAEGIKRVLELMKESNAENVEADAEISWENL